MQVLHKCSRRILNNRIRDEGRSYTPFRRQQLAARRNIFTDENRRTLSNQSCFPFLPIPRDVLLLSCFAYIYAHVRWTVNN